MTLLIWFHIYDHSSSYLQYKFTICFKIYIFTSGNVTDIYNANTSDNMDIIQMAMEDAGVKAGVSDTSDIMDIIQIAMADAGVSDTSDDMDIIQMAMEAAAG